MLFKLLDKAEYGKSEIVDIALGKYKLPLTLKAAKRKIIHTLIDKRNDKESN